MPSFRLWIAWPWSRHKLLAEPTKERDLDGIYTDMYGIKIPLYGIYPYHIHIYMGYIYIVYMGFDVSKSITKHPYHPYFGWHPPLMVILWIVYYCFIYYALLTLLQTTTINIDKLVLSNIQIL